MTEFRVVTIDGPAGAGKSSVARLLAERLGFAYLDTGAMYRAVTLIAIERGIGDGDDAALKRLALGLELEFTADGRLLADGRDVSADIRSADVTSRVSAYASNPGVRSALAAAQRRIGERSALVCEGRDMGTVVFPDAAVRIYLDASPRVRADRRHRELAERGEATDYATLLAEIVARDAADAGRIHAPLKRVDGQIYVDTSGQDRDQVVEELHRVASRGLANA